MDGKWQIALDVTVGVVASPPLEVGRHYDLVVWQPVPGLTTSTVVLAWNAAPCYWWVDALLTRPDLEEIIQGVAALKLAARHIPGFSDAGGQLAREERRRGVE
jgi:hypothetical protein